jgi:integrase/recombinase XerD
MREGCRVRVSGPLAEYADGFWDELAAHGYTGQVRDRNVRMLAHVSRWMIEQGLSVAELTPARLGEFLGARRREGYHHGLSMRAVMPLVEHLRALGVAPHPSVAEPVGGLDVVVADYRRYLLGERALTAAVVGRYTRLAREFLATMSAGGVPASGPSAAAVADYVVRQCRARPAGSAKYLVTGLRSVLEFLFLAGHLGQPLALAVPGVAHWGAGSLPRGAWPAGGGRAGGQL